MSSRSTGLLGSERQSEAQENSLGQKLSSAAYFITNALVWCWASLILPSWSVCPVAEIEVPMGFNQQTFGALEVLGSYGSKWLTSYRTVNISSAEMLAAGTLQKHLGL